jgi:hypothetical protein
MHLSSLLYRSISRDMLHHRCNPEHTWHSSPLQPWGSSRAVEVARATPCISLTHEHFLAPWLIQMFSNFPQLRCPLPLHHQQQPSGWPPLGARGVSQVTTGRLIFDQPWPSWRGIWNNTVMISMSNLHTAWLLPKSWRTSVRCPGGTQQHFQPWIVLATPWAKQKPLVSRYQNNSLIGPWQISSMSPIHDWRYSSGIHFILWLRESWCLGNLKPCCTCCQQTSFGHAACSNHLTKCLLSLKTTTALLCSLQCDRDYKSDSWCEGCRWRTSSLCCHTMYRVPVRRLLHKESRHDSESCSSTFQGTSQGKLVHCDCMMRILWPLLLFSVAHASKFRDSRTCHAGDTAALLKYPKLVCSEPPRLALSVSFTLAVKQRTIHLHRRGCARPRKQSVSLIREDCAASQCPVLSAQRSRRDVQGRKITAVIRYKPVVLRLRSRRRWRAP